MVGAAITYYCTGKINARVEIMAGTINVRCKYSVNCDLVYRKSANYPSQAFFVHKSQTFFYLVNLF